MGRHGVTYTDVANAAQQLITSNKTPTIEAIRALLGTGSNSTLSMHLQTWRNKQDQIQNLPSKENLPEELIITVQGIWDKVMDHAAEKVQQIKQEKQLSIEALQKTIQEIQASHADLQVQYERISHAKDEIAREKLTVEQLYSTSKLEIAMLTEKLIAAEQQSQEKQAHIDNLTKQNLHIQANLEHYRAVSLEQRMTEQQHYEQQIRQHESYINNIQQELSAIQTDHSTIQEQYYNLNAENSRLKNQLAISNAQIELVTNNLDTINIALNNKTLEAQHWQNKYDTIFAKVATQISLYPMQINLPTSPFNKS